MDIKHERYVFYIEPVSAPRMTQSDKWKLDINHKNPRQRQRMCVHKYFKFKDELKKQCLINGYKLEPVLNICFVIEMPKYWSSKKKFLMDGKPHKQRPDRDNLLKAFQDAFVEDDAFIYDGRTTKLWGYFPKIVVY
jgi:Holliday junction resolvase RusA-like endonuclease